LANRRRNCGLRRKIIDEITRKARIDFPRAWPHEDALAATLRTNTRRQKP
jgi:hypothetical protein